MYNPTMTSYNDNVQWIVQWYDYSPGFRMYFPNGYGISIIPGHTGDTMEVMVVSGDGTLFDAAVARHRWPRQGDTAEVVMSPRPITPALLGDFINQIRDLPPRTP